MGEASQISLKAIGKQDTHLLSKDPEDSFFNYKIQILENIIVPEVFQMIEIFLVGHLVKP